MNSRNNRTMTQGFGLVVIVALAAMLPAQGYGASTGISISAVPPEVTATTWGRLASVEYNDTYATVVFPAYSGTPSPDNPVHGHLRTTLETAEGAFAGDYLAAGIEGIAFEAKYEGIKAAAAVEIVTASGRRWLNSSLINLGDEPGTWVRNNVALDPRAGWSRDDSQSTPENWAQDLRNVVSVGVSLAQRGTSWQSVSINAFVLLSEDEVVTPFAVLSQRLYERFGTYSVAGLTDAQRALDSSGNGIADWLEILVTQTNPDDAIDSLLISVRRTPEGLNEVTWPAVVNGRYRLQSAPSPAGPWTDVPGAASVQTARKAPFSIVDADSAEGSRFYRVLQRNPFSAD